MARSIVIEYVDDLDGTSGPDVTTLEFSLDGVQYEIDLSSHNASTMRTVLEPFLKAARRSPSRSRVNRPRPAPAVSADSDEVKEVKAIRDWARSQGLKVGTSGRLAANVTTAYFEAQDRPEMPPITYADRATDPADGMVHPEYNCWTPFST